MVDIEVRKYGGVYDGFYGCSWHIDEQGYLFVQTEFGVQAVYAPGGWSSIRVVGEGEDQ